MSAFSLLVKQKLRPPSLHESLVLYLIGVSMYVYSLI